MTDLKRGCGTKLHLLDPDSETIRAPRRSFWRHSDDHREDQTSANSQATSRSSGLRLLPSGFEEHFRPERCTSLITCTCTPAESHLLSSRDLVQLWRYDPALLPAVIAPGASTMEPAPRPPGSSTRSRFLNCWARSATRSISPKDSRPDIACDAAGSVSKSAGKSASAGPRSPNSITRCC